MGAHPTEVVRLGGLIAQMVLDGDLPGNVVGKRVLVPLVFVLFLVIVAAKELLKGGNELIELGLQVGNYRGCE